MVYGFSRHCRLEINWPHIIVCLYLYINQIFSLLITFCFGLVYQWYQFWCHRVIVSVIWDPDRLVEWDLDLSLCLNAQKELSIPGELKEHSLKTGLVLHWNTQRHVHIPKCLHADTYYFSINQLVPSRCVRPSSHQIPNHQDQGLGVDYRKSLSHLRLGSLFATIHQ